MDGYLPLKPGGSAFSIAGGPTPSPGAQLLPGSGEAVYLFDNSRNSVAAWIGYGMTSGMAQSNAIVAPLGGTSPAFPLAKTTVQAITLNAGLFFSVIMETGSGTVTGIAGYGV